jgi:hypothetical protein
MEGSKQARIRGGVRRRRRGGATARRGAEVLEAALVFPILLALAFGTVEFGYYFYTEHNLTCAAREGARAAIPSSVDPGNRAAECDAAVAYVMSHSGYPGGSYNINRGTSADGKYFEVKVQLRWGSVNGGLRPMRLCNANTVVEGAAAMRIEEPLSP